MSIQSGADTSSGYFARLALVVSTQTRQLVRSPAQANRADAARRLKHNVVTIAVVAAGLIAALMIWVDAWEISKMPPRGFSGLWPFRILTDFGKDTKVLALTAVLLIAVAFVAPAMHGPSRRWLLAIGMRLQYVLFALAVPLFVGEILKWIVGRGRPFVGASPFDFVPFAGTEAHSAFPPRTP